MRQTYRITDEIQRLVPWQESKTPHTRIDFDMDLQFTGILAGINSLDRVKHFSAEQSKRDPILPRRTYSVRRGIAQN
ncbi:hypothetical protein D3C77_591770 [compost metagenome]